MSSNAFAQDRSLDNERSSDRFFRAQNPDRETGRADAARYIAVTKPVRLHRGRMREGPPGWRRRYRRPNKEACRPRRTGTRETKGSRFIEAQTLHGKLLNSDERSRKSRIEVVHADDRLIAARNALRDR